MAECMDAALILVIRSKMHTWVHGRARECCTDLGNKVRDAHMGPWQSAQMCTDFGNKVRCTLGSMAEGVNSALILAIRSEMHT